MARPSDFKPELLEEICDRLSQGQPLAAICRDDHMPSDRTVRNWMAQPDVSSAIARAREVGFDKIAADCLDIADDRSGDVRLTGGGEGDEPREVCNTEFVQRAKLRIDTRLKLLAKWDPKRYGDKLALTGGDDGDAPIKTVTRIELIGVRPGGDAAA